LPCFAFSASFPFTHTALQQVVLTITLAGGTKAMVARHVIVRKLDSLEALGAVTDICSDKTGIMPIFFFSLPIEN
jgi:hypothetical protein